MAVGYRLPAGGLPSAVKALLVPENIRAGVHIKGGGVDVVGAVMPYAVPENGIVGMLCFAQSAWYCCETPYFAWNGSNGMVCRKACRADVVLNGKADHGNLNKSYADVYINAVRVIHDDSAGWNFNGTVTWEFVPGDMVTVGFSGDNMGDKKHLKIEFDLKR